jgi:hypothetical protein
MEVPEAYHFSPAHPKLPRQLVLRVGSVEDAFEVRTTLMSFFSILLIFRCSPLPTSDM